MLGGTPKILARDVDTNITFTPDGKHIAYARGNDPEMGKWQLLTANPDGSDEKKIAGGPSGDAPSFLHWMPGGKQVLGPLNQTTDALAGLRVFDTASSEWKTVAKGCCKTPIFQKPVARANNFVEKGAAMVALSCRL